MYGAGNIGRGFIGHLLHDSGYKVVFVDVNQDVVSALNERHAYTQLLMDGDGVEHREITGVRTVDGRDKTAVAREIAAYEVMAVSVGAAILPRIAPLLATGLELRDTPLNILVCENLAHGPSILHGYVAEQLADPSVSWARPSGAWCRSCRRSSGQATRPASPWSGFVSCRWTPTRWYSLCLR